MKISIAQIKPKIGNLTHNAEKILDFYRRATGEIVLFPELSLTGYTPRDLLFYPEFLRECEKKLMEIMGQIGEKICVAGLPLFENGVLYNANVAIQNGKIIATSFKHHLAKGEIFDEHRYFSSGKTQMFTHKGINFALPICEDIWHEDICKNLKSQGANVLLVSNASPFYTGKNEERIATAKKRFDEIGLPIIYCNQVANQDGVLYDGSSFYYNNGITKQAPQFEECLLEISLNEKPIEVQQIKKITEIYNALIFGLKEYVLNSGFAKVIIGLSGGADSALVAYLATQSFGKENVICIFMPSKFTSEESFQDAHALCNNLQISLQTIPIQEIVDTFTTILNLTGLAYENIQARIRGNILMSISNQNNAMVLTTGNKSEIATGYCTLYGDMCGAYNPIKDLYKTQVFEIMRYINQTFDEKIPENIITKEPSAELKHNQKDSDSLPQYHILDEILRELMEGRKSIEEITHFDINTVQKVFNLMKNSEYKRSQGVVGTKISTQSFEKSEWRYNI